jgi:hypothetical protein
MALDTDQWRAFRETLMPIIGHIAKKLGFSHSPKTYCHEAIDDREQLHITIAAGGQLWHLYIELPYALIKYGEYDRLMDCINNEAEAGFRAIRSRVLGGPAPTGKPLEGDNELSQRLLACAQMADKAGTSTALRELLLDILAGMAEELGVDPTPWEEGGRATLDRIAAVITNGHISRQQIMNMAKYADRQMGYEGIHRTSDAYRSYDDTPAERVHIVEGMRRQGLVGMAEAQRLLGYPGLGDD